MKMKKRSGGGGANWQDTYGDMVTLLLCFFVLLYSISSVDESKWLALVRSFNPEAVEAMRETPGAEGPAAEDYEGKGLHEYDNMSMEELLEFQNEVDQALDQIYESMRGYADQTGTRIEVTRGDGYVFISFSDTVFFDGDSYVLRTDGKEVLTVVANTLSSASPYIDEVRILGHTAQATQNNPNPVNADRFLASNRATIATVFIQENSTLDPGRLVSVGYGQHRPVDLNDTSEARSHNRRVEFIVTGQDVSSKLGDSVEQYYNMRTGESITEDSSTAEDSTVDSSTVSEE